jgi:hypothetical protein
MKGKPFLDVPEDMLHADANKTGRRRGMAQIEDDKA